MRFRKDDGEITKDFSEGENINCNFRIMNSGSFDSEETSITIFVDEIPRWNLDLLPMKSGDNRTFEHSFELEGGRHYVRFEIDANNSVHEINDQFMHGSRDDSNVWTYIIDVEEKDGKETGSSENLSLFTLILFVSITVIISLIAASMFLSKRKEGPYEE